MRLGLGAVRHIGDELAERHGRGAKSQRPIYVSAGPDHRLQLSVPQTEALATAGALGCFGMSRREGLWAAGAAATQRPDRLPGVGSSSHVPALPGMTELELAAADVWATGISPDSYPVAVPAGGPRRDGGGPRRALRSVPDGSRVLIAGAVTHRQRPGDGAGRDIPEPGGRDRDGQRDVHAGGVGAAPQAGADGVGSADPRPRAERERAVTIVADRMGHISLSVGSKSRDFR